MLKKMCVVLLAVLLLTACNTPADPANLTEGSIGEYLYKEDLFQVEFWELFEPCVYDGEVTSRLDLSLIDVEEILTFYCTDEMKETADTLVAMAEAFNELQEAYGYFNSSAYGKTEFERASDTLYQLVHFEAFYGDLEDYDMRLEIFSLVSTQQTTKSSKCGRRLEEIKQRLSTQNYEEYNDPTKYEFLDLTY